MRGSYQLDVMDTPSSFSAISVRCKELEMTGSRRRCCRAFPEQRASRLLCSCRKENTKRSRRIHRHNDPQANGEAERAVQEVKAQLRATKLGLEARVREEVHVDRPILELMIPHAAQTLNRCSSRRIWPHSTLLASHEEFHKKSFRVRRTSTREAPRTEQNHQAQNVGEICRTPFGTSRWWARSDRETSGF